MAKNFKGEEIEVGDVVSINFKVVQVTHNRIDLRRIEGNGSFTCSSTLGEVSIVKKIEKPLAIGDKIKIDTWNLQVGVTRTIVAFDGDSCVYRLDVDGTAPAYDGTELSRCSRDPR